MDFSEPGEKILIDLGEDPHSNEEKFRRSLFESVHDGASKSSIGSTKGKLVMVLEFVGT